MSETKQLVGPKVCLMGPSGNGKTYSLGTLVDWAAKNGFEVAILFTDAGAETLFGYWKDRNKEIPECLYYHQELTRPVTLASQLSMAEQVGRISFQAVTNLQDPNRAANNAFWKILSSCSNFIDDRTGKVLGPVDSFPDKRIFVIDGLTEMANAAMKMEIGARPAASMGEYQVAQYALMNFLRLCTQGVACPFVLLAHVDRETNPVTQTTAVMIKAIGKALAPDLPAIFSDVIYAKRDKSNFTWTTSEFGVDTKTRSLGYREGIAPDFGQIMDLWLKRRGA